MWKMVWLLLSAVLLTACRTIPDTIQVSDNTQLVQYQQVVSAPSDAAGKVARWGGVIANVSNQSKGTLVEMVHFPIKSYGRPQIGDQSIGRFRVHVDGFLDPLVYKAGRSITFVGDVTGTESGKIGEQEYIFPALQAKSYHLWKEIPDIEVAHIDLWPYHYGYYPWPYYPRSYVIKRNNRRHSSVGTPAPSVPSSRPMASQPSSGPKKTEHSHRK